MSEPVFPSESTSGDSSQEDIAPRIEQIAPYVSPFLLRRFLVNPRPLAEPFEESLNAAVLTADIAGFSRLTERLDSEGLAGVERLSELLNRCFEVLLALLESHGGAVLNFTGDGLTAVWPAVEGDPVEATLRAAVCSLAMQSAMEAFAPGEEIRLTMRLGLATGEACFLAVGGVEDHWLTVLAGECVERSIMAAQAASPGQVIVSPQTWHVLWGRAAGSEETGGFVALTSADDSLEPGPMAMGMPAGSAVRGLLQHVPVAIRGRLDGSPSRWLAEYRPASLLFIGIPEVALYGHGALKRAHEVTVLLQRLVQRYEGTVDALPVEFGGLSMLAGFGLPPLSHEDDASRAVRAALAIREELRDAGYTGGIGVTTGSLFCGLIGGKTRRTFTMVGDAVNRSARLMRLAEDDVLCDGATWEAAKRQIRFNFLGNAAVRGRTETVAIYRPLGEKEQVAPETSDFVGRRVEKQVLDGAVRDLLAEQRGGLILIEGDAGIGKSALVANMIGTAEQKTVKVLFGTGDSIEQSHSYRAWRSVFGSMLDLPGNGDRDEREEKVLAALNGFPSALRIVPVLNSALSVNFPENEITENMTPQSRSEAANDALVEMLAVASELAPTLVVLDDCHWLDSASFLLAEEVRKRLPRLLLVMLSRPRNVMFQSSEWARLWRREGVRHLLLKELTREDTDELVRRRLRVREVPEEVYRIIRERAEGHPLFCEQLAYSLRDSGQVVVEGPVCKLVLEGGILQAIRFPENVQGVVRERVDRLPEDERLVLKIASVVGRYFDVGTLRAVLPTENAAVGLDEILGSLARTQFLSAPEDGSCFFRHAIIQEVCYELLTLSQRRRLHERVAARIEEVEKENLEPHYPSLAYHWKTADVPKKAVQFQACAGARALRQFANREAIAFLQEALSGAEEVGIQPLQRGCWHRQIGEAFFRMGRMEQAKEHLQKAVALLGFPVPPPFLMKTLMLPASLLRQMLTRCLGGALFVTDHSLEARLEAIKAYGILGEIAFFTNDLFGTLFSCVHGLNLAESSGVPSAMAHPYATMMIACASVPPVAIGRHYMKLTKGSMDALETPDDEGYALALMSMYYGGVGEWREGSECLARAEAIFTRFGNFRRLEDSLTIRIYSLLNQGHFSEAGEAVETMLESARRRDDPQTLSWARLMHAQWKLPTQGGEEALKALDPGPTTTTDTLTLAANYAIESAGWLRTGESGRARVSADASLQLLKNGPPVAFSLSLSVYYLAGVYLALFEDAQNRKVGGEPGLKNAVRQALGVVGGFARVFPIGRPRAFLWRAVDATLTGRNHKARRLWEKAIAAAEKLGMTHDIGVICYHRGRLAMGNERAQLLDKAMRIFEKTGAEYDLARAAEIAATVQTDRHE